MSREIKFRAWVKHPESGKMLMRTSFYLLNSAGEMNYRFPNDKTVCEKETVMQYTGLKDKNGTEIYEGDVVRVVVDKVDKICTVKFQLGTFIMAVLSEDWYWTFGEKGENREVIGNIYENPELLGE